MSATSDSVSQMTEKKAKGSDKTTTSKVADAAHNVIDDTAAKAEAVENQIRNRAARAGEKVEATQEAASRKLESSVERAEAFAREQPIAAAGIAFAAGVLAAALLRR